MAVTTSLCPRASLGGWRMAVRGARRWTRRAVHAAPLLCTVGLAPALRAQEPAPTTPPHSPSPRPWLVTTAHYGKWLTLAGAAGLIATSAVRHGKANDAIDRLEQFCRQDFDRCAIVGNRYLDDMAEEIFQEHAALDREAQGFLIGGQATLIVSGAMFLIDLMWDDDETENIPYTPLRVWSEPGHLGLSLSF